MLGSKRRGGKGGQDRRALQEGRTISHRCFTRAVTQITHAHTCTARADERGTGTPGARPQELPAARRPQCPASARAARPQRRREGAAGTGSHGPPSAARPPARSRRPQRRRERRPRREPVPGWGGPARGGRRQRQYLSPPARAFSACCRGTWCCGWRRLSAAGSPGSRGCRGRRASATAAAARARCSPAPRPPAARLRAAPVGWVTPRSNPTPPQRPPPSPPPVGSGGRRSAAPSSARRRRPGRGGAGRGPETAAGREEAPGPGLGRRGP